jgi:hypothetical protein
MLAFAIAVFGILGMLLVDHGPWSRPVVSSRAAGYRITSAAAHADGATVTPTPPKLQLEPVHPAPNPVAPSNP